MDNCLLIGNGLNRCLEHSIAWDCLLKDIADQYGVQYNGNISMPLEFESIVNEIQKNSNAPTDNLYKEIKKKVAEKLHYTKLPEKAIHMRLSALKLNSIMTTNYDYLLEYVFNPAYTYIYRRDQKKYLLDETSKQEGISFYHPHGLAGNPQTICLGYEHYMGIVQNLRYEINTKEKNKANSMHIKRVLFGEVGPSNTWGEKFYTSNIGIIGLGLTECEVDLWWLITHRAFLYYSNYEGIRKKLKNKIIYFDIVDKIEKDDDSSEKKRMATVNMQLSRQRLLNNEHVIVKPYVLGKEYQSYEEAYNAIFDDIKEEGLDGCLA